MRNVIGVDDDGSRPAVLTETGEAGFLGSEFLGDEPVVAHLDDESAQFLL